MTKLMTEIAPLPYGIDSESDGLTTNLFIGILLFEFKILLEISLKNTAFRMVKSEARIFERPFR